MSNKLIWLDLEMTGLQVQYHKIVEIATVVTDFNLNIIAKGPNLVIYHTQNELDKMDTWVAKHHERSGLIKKIKESQLSEKEAEQETLGFLKYYVKPGTSPMCGNSICMDRRFLSQWMPDLEAFFHYRNLDVSSLKILIQAWFPQVAKKVIKKNNHRSLDDTIESIEELKLYRKEFWPNK